MLPLELYQGIESAWCPGCGNFGILKAFKQALAELEIKPEGLLMVSAQTNECVVQRALAGMQDKSGHR